MKETDFTATLARIGFPPHNATFKAAIKGWPTREYAMEPEEALRVARIVMWYALLRRWEKDPYGPPTT